MYKFLKIFLIELLNKFDFENYIFYYFDIAIFWLILVHLNYPSIIKVFPISMILEMKI